MPLLSDIVIICGLALAVNFVCHRFGVPALVGYLLTGVLAGPHGLGVVGQVSNVEHLAEIGVVCLLFTIGLELSVGRLARIKLLALTGGSVQVGVTIAATTVTAAPGLSR